MCIDLKEHKRLFKSISYHHMTVNSLTILSESMSAGYVYNLCFFMSNIEDGRL